MFPVSIHFPLPNLLAAAPELSIWPLASSVLIGVSLFVLSRTIRNSLHTDDLEQSDAWQYDVSRINALRRVSPLYRVFQPVIQGFAQINRSVFKNQLPEVHRQIQASGRPRFWTAPEYLARLQLLSLLLAPAYSWFCTRILGSEGLVLAVMMTGLNFLYLRYRLAATARYRLFRIKKRLPFLLDLLTLLMEAGSTFLQALDEAVSEFRDHPVGVEFGRVLAELAMGKSRTAALESMRDRLSDDEITSIVGSIVQGENLGTPLALLFRTQADVLRIKRSQRAETLAGEAGVKMLAPAVLVMAATVIIILGPFVLSFIYADFMS
jgi:tight adherence protein C